MLKALKNSRGKIGLSDRWPRGKTEKPSRINADVTGDGDVENIDEYWWSDDINSCASDRRPASRRGSAPAREGRYSSSARTPGGVERGCRHTPMGRPFPEILGKP